MSNQLANSSSPYLRQHADNPVDWMEWSDAALERARLENKLIFLSVGYSTCHWCHVMAHESFEDKEVAAALGRDFIAIKVDREERPDLDALAMDYVLATRGQGGWPLTLVLTPTGLPVFGGTYFPARDGERGTGLMTILAELSKLWQEDPARFERSGAEAQERLAQHHAALRAQARGEVPGAEIFAAALKQLGEHWDWERGGTGGGPKFPRPSTLLGLVRLANRADTEGTEDEAATARKMIGSQLEAMARGGLRDQLGGGFHRYTVDGAWRIPHYEKMLYDQAQLILAWTEAAQLGGVLERESARGIVAETIEFCLRELGAEDGSFFSALDADSAPAAGEPAREGAFYVWSAEELQRRLGAEDALFFARIYACGNGGNAPKGTDPHGELSGLNTLWLPQDLEQALLESETAFAWQAGKARQRLDQIRATLLAARAERPRPHRDEKIIASWNGLMIAALARAGRVFDEQDWVRRAQRAAGALQDLLGAGSEQFRRSGIDGKAGEAAAQASDHAAWIWGLLELGESTLEAKWVELAQQAQRHFDATCWDSETNLYLSVDPRRLSHPSWALAEDEDGAEPAANSVAARNLLRLALLGDDQACHDKAKAILEASAGTLRGGGGLQQPLRLVALADFLDELGTDSFVGGHGTPDWDDELRRRRSADLLPLQILAPLDLAAEPLPAQVECRTILRCRPGRCELV